MSDDDRYRRFNLRIPKDVFAALQVVADAHSHSMNAEIIQRLEQSMRIHLRSSEIKTDELDQEEAALVELWRELDSDHRNAMVSLISGLIRAKKYI